MDCLEAFALSTGIDAASFDKKGHLESITGCNACAKLCAERAKNDAQCGFDHCRAMENALQTGETYICQCHAGLVFAAAPVMRQDSVSGSVCALPCRMTQEETEGVFVEPVRMRAVSDMLYSLAVRLSGGESPLLTRNRESAMLQRSVAETASAASLHRDYPLEVERLLLEKVRMGDRNGARALLNKLLSGIFLNVAGNLDIVKARLLELVVMISRAAVESGAEMESLMGMNSRFIGELSRAKDFEEVCLWVVRALDSFMDAVSATKGGTSERLLNEADAYIARHLQEELTLETVAGAVHASPFYLSHLYKKRRGESFVECVTKRRMEEAKKRLCDRDATITGVAFSVGYADAGYFTKVFKKHTGMTPRQYKNRNA